jgi:SARP family transcriptional regulator, regulator of embCAB operon
MTRIYLTGRVTIETSDHLVEPSAFPGRQGRLAFVRLAAAPRRVERDHLADTLWPDLLPDAWEGALAAVISKLKRTLAVAGLGDALESSDGCYELRWPTQTWIDLREAINALDRSEGSLRRGDARAAWSDATVASAVLRRRFLPGESGPWVDQVRRDLLDAEIRTHDTLAAVWLLEGRPVAAIQAARRAVDLAPFRESTHARLMEAHLAAGNRAEAIRTYEDVRALLRDSMGIEPTEHVQRLYEQALG